MYHIIYNPSSGQKKTQKAVDAAKEILGQRGCEGVFHATEGKGHCTEIVREINASSEQANVLIVGGDGTFSEALNGVVDFDRITFGLIPAGTGNDFARKLRIPFSPEKALVRALDGKETLLDYIDLNGKRCLNVCGLGMDVDVLVKYASMKHFSGRIKYYLSLFYVLTHFKPHRVRFKIGDLVGEQDVFMVGACNGSYIGGGMALAPDSSVTDGLLDLVVIDNIKKPMIPIRLVPFLLGRMNRQSCTHIYQAAEAEIEILGEDPARVQVDGEVLEMSKLCCRVVPRKLRMLL